MSKSPFSSRELAKFINQIYPTYFYKFLYLSNVGQNLCLPKELIELLKHILFEFFKITFYQYDFLCDGGKHIMRQLAYIQKYTDGLNSPLYLSMISDEFFSNNPCIISINGQSYWVDKNFVIKDDDRLYFKMCHSCKCEQQIRHCHGQCPSCECLNLILPFVRSFNTNGQNLLISEPEMTQKKSLTIKDIREKNCIHCLKDFYYSVECIGNQ